MPDAQSSAITGVFGRPFAEQVAFFRQKLGNLVPTRTWRDMQGAAHDSGFMVAGAAKADLLASLAAAIDRAQAEGTSLEAFRKDFRAAVTATGWTGWTGEGTAGGEAWRTRTIYVTNTKTAYHAGRLAQLRAGNYAYWVYRHNDSVRHPRPEHLSWDGITLPSDHPFWATHYTPNGWGCECYIVGARSLAAARRLGGKPEKSLPAGWDGIDPATGAPPGIDEGWGYMPGGSVSDDIRRAVAKKAEALSDGLGAALRADAAAIPPAPPAADMPKYRVARTVKEAQTLAQEILDAPGGVAYATTSTGEPLVRFRHGRTVSAGVRDNIYGKANYAGLDLDTVNVLNRELIAMQTECDRLGIPRLRAVKSGAGRAIASMGDGVLSLSKNIKMRPRYELTAGDTAPGSAPLSDKPYNAMRYFSDPAEAARSLLWHEFAHHVHQQLGVSNMADYAGPPLEKRLAEFVRAARGDLIIPSRYAATNSKEFFAESFSLYKMGRTDIIDPRVIAIIQDIEGGSAL